MTMVIAAGMPSSGKSTFIAALTHLLTAGQVPTELTLARLSEDEGHLNRLEQAWLAAAELDRTKKTSERWVSFLVAERVAGIQSELLVPDLRGELFAQPATVGRCQPRLWSALLECDGLLLFTNADGPTDDLMIDQVSQIAGCVADLEGSENPPSREEGAAEIGGGEAESFRADDMPEEAKLVELLQAMNRAPVAPKKRRLALIISAWDVVDATLQPADWIFANRPMLHQFLKHSSEFWDVRLYGVSAQGGDLEKDQKRLQSIRLPGERVVVVGPEVRAHDLTAIIKWVASARDA